MANADVALEIVYPVNDPRDTVIRTNLKPEGVEEILETWLHHQFGQGEDRREPNEKDVYTIRIGVQLSDDTFIVNSDTGNKSLTTGIVLDVFRRLASIPQQPFGQRAGA